MNSPGYSAVIVNFNTGKHLATCLQSVTDHMGPVVWETIVIDNASTDGSEGVVERFGPRCRLVRNPENRGFSRAVNQGLAATSGELVLILNPDCRLLPAAIGTLTSELQRHSRCAVVGPRVLNDDGSVQGSARGDPAILTGLFGRSTWLTRLFPQLPLTRRNVRTLDVPPHDATSYEVDWVSGACLLARRSALEEAGGFDERYFMYWEDADLCRRLRNLGYSIRYVPGATVVHSVGASRRAAPTQSIRAFHDSAYLYYVTHVARSPYHPLRWVAWTLLRLRCAWQLWSGATEYSPRWSNPLK